MKLEVPEILWNVPFTGTEILEVGWYNGHVNLLLDRPHTGRETHTRNVYLQEYVERLLESFRSLVIEELNELRHRKQAILTNATPSVRAWMGPAMAPDFKQIEDTLYYLYSDPVPTLWDRLEAGVE
jgi:hypothetical protein